jgi:hypothetical protein
MSEEIAEPKYDFTCHKCGVQCDSAPMLPKRATCPNCCEDHWYIYERGLGHYCETCGQEPPHDWYTRND